MYTVKRATIIEFIESKDIWNNLVLQMKLPTIFCTWEWIYTWWEHFGNKYKLFILFIYDNDKLKGILPLAGQRTLFRNGYITGMVLTFCGVRELHPAHIDIICSTEEQINCLTALMDYLQLNTSLWDVIQLPHVSRDSNILSFIENGDSQIISTVQRISVAPYISMPGCFEDYLKSLKKKHRENLRNRRKKLFDENGIKYEVCSPSRYSEGIDMLFKLHNLRANKKKMKTPLSDSRILDYHRSLLDKIGERGWVSINFLKKEDHVIAASYNFIYGKTVFSYQKGIDPSWENMGPGSVLLYELINETFVRGDREYNFLQGSEGYKYQWAKEERELFLINLFNKTISGTISKKAYNMKNRIKAIYAR